MGLKVVHLRTPFKSAHTHLTSTASFGFNHVIQRLLLTGALGPSVSSVISVGALDDVV